MDQQDLQMFARLARGEPRLADWIKAELDQITTNLVAAPEDSRFRVLQGQAQFAQRMLKHIDAGKATK